MMKQQLSTWRWAIGAIFLSSALAVGLWGLASSEVRAEREQDSDKYEHNAKHSGDRYRDKEDDQLLSSSQSSSSPTHKLYTEECGSCHLAYPAGLLGTNSWQAIMSNLDDHFGENAELADLELSQIQDYLSLHAADNSSYQNSRYVDKTGSLVLRITEQPFFIRKHDEVPDRLVSGNEQVGSFSQCDRCHRNAVKGNFDEDEISIPGYGRWD